MTPSPFLCLLLTVSLALCLAARRAPDLAAYDLLVFPREQGCLNKFLALDVKGLLADTFCLKKTISKCLGYGIIAGSTIVKLPQIVNFVRAGSVEGVSRASSYLELVGYLLVSVFHIVMVRERAGSTSA